MISVRIDFYQVELPNDLKLGDLLQKINKIPIDKRNLKIEGEFYRIQELHFEKNLIIGDMIRIRMDDKRWPGFFDSSLRFLSGKLPMFMPPPTLVA